MRRRIFRYNHPMIANTIEYVITQKPLCTHPTHTSVTHTPHTLHKEQLFSRPHTPHPPPPCTAINNNYESKTNQVTTCSTGRQAPYRHTKHTRKILDAIIRSSLAHIHPPTHPPTHTHTHVYARTHARAPPHTI